jgi:hypothetical protein
VSLIFEDGGNTVLFNLSTTPTIAAKQNIIENKTAKQKYDK